MLHGALKKLPPLILLLCLRLFTIAQQADSTIVSPVADSSKSKFVTTLQQKGREETVNSLEKYRLGRIAIKQTYLLEEIKNTTQRAKIYFRKGIDTLGVLEELNKTNEALTLVKEGIFVNTGTIQTQRNLAVSSAILSELLVKMTNEQKKVADYNEDLVGFRDRIDSLSTDTALYTFPSDSIATVKYIQRILVVVKDLGPTDTAINRAQSTIQDLQTKVDMMVFTLHSALEDVERFRIELTKKSFSPELPYIHQAPQFSRPLSEIISFSKAKEKLALNYYISDNAGRILLLLILIIIANIFIRSLKDKLTEEKNLDPTFKGQLSLRYPLLSAIFLIVNIFQFIFLDPPFIFECCLWLISAVCLCFIFNRFISRYWMHFWLTIMLLFLLAGLNNMILQASRTERWVMLLLSFVGAGFSIYVLVRGKKYSLRERGLVYFILFVIVMETASFFANIFGRFNLSKTLLMSGYSGILIAVLFLWTVRLLNETLSLTSTVYKHPDKRLFYINFDKIGDKVPAVFYFFLVVGWLILVGRNFYSFKQMAAHFNDFLTTERTLGNYNFSINGLFIFFFILICSVLLSKIISFFAEPAEAHQKANTNKVRKVGIGSWLLLVRIFIISVGLFLAFAASGIPLDKITIIIGALGVGIGLGLQGLVNNLVSGLIIAFEKPVNVGDNIEVNNKTGVMKSIGFRSSVVTLADGANLIIPNGDLLSQQLVNWTMGKNIKRLALTVGVAYETDLEKAQDILNKLLLEDERIKTYPAPVVAPTKFGSSTIDIQLYYWVSNVGDAAHVTGDLITKITSSFKEVGIEIPYPQQDLNIRSFSNIPGQTGDDNILPTTSNNKS